MCVCGNRTPVHERKQLRRWTDGRTDGQIQARQDEISAICQGRRRRVPTHTHILAAAAEVSWVHDMRQGEERDHVESRHVRYVQAKKASFEGRLASCRVG